ncbi:MAG TPA: YdcF family protein [Bryobacterales bacterium]|nr:YdcF family protein [Bryobacterales bacterium]
MLGLTIKNGVWKRAGSRRKWLLAVALVAALYLGRTLWLRGIGEFLVRAEPPQAADLGVVLAGDGYGHRILKGVELVRQGYVRQLLVDGPRGMYGFDESQLAIHYAVDEGAPPGIFIPFPIQARSTVAEARMVDAELRKRGVHKALIITSNFHTRRAGSVFRHFGSAGIQYIVVAAPDEDFAPGDWWRSREAQKVVFFEYAKLFHWWLLE